MASFSDDFNRADNTDLGAGWAEVSGDWSIISNRLSPGVDTGTVILRAAGAMDSSDHSAQVTIAVPAVASLGVWCRGNSNISSGYLWRNDGSTWDLFSVVSSTFNVIATYAEPAAPGDVARVQAVGSTIKAFVNGIERASVTDTAVASGTSVGLRTGTVTGIRYDDFTAADVTAGATLSTATAAEAAQPLMGTKVAALGTATEAGGALTLIGAKAATLTPAAEQAAAQELLGAKARALDVAGTVESAHPLTGAKTATLPPAAEQSTAQTVAGAKTGTLGTAGSVETAQPLTQVDGVTLPTASTTETAQPLTGAKTATLAPALEVCTARPLAPQPTTVSSPERTLQVPAEHRRLVVAAEGRTLTVR
jgi:hypothetical protein